MLKRFISALIGAPLLLGLIYLGGPYTAFLVSALSLLALREFLQIGEHMGMHAWYKLTTLVALVWLISLFIGGKDWMLPVMVFWLLIGLGRLALTYPKTLLPEAGFNLLSIFYTVLLSYLYLLRQLPRGMEWAFFAILLVWATDTGAYLIGRQFGRHLLAPHVSPKKTVEGSLGGLMFSIIVAIVFWRIIGGTSWIPYIFFGVVIGISAQVGDLFESALKRSAGVKDSGMLIPGHGGILDRFDSLIFALPLVYYGVILLT
ncbi:MAG TPA: phosphatidate cytidylyltransferase [Desulfosporosinus sp.]